MLIDPKTIELNVYQIKPTDKLLALSSNDIIDMLINTNMSNHDDVIERIKPAKTVRDLFDTFDGGDRESNRWLTRIMNTVLASNQVYGGIGWDRSNNGIQITTPEVIGNDNNRQILTAKYASLSADKKVDGNVVFNVAVKNKVFFDKNIPVQQFYDELLRHMGQCYLPANDISNGSNCIITGLSRKPVFHNLPNSSIKLGEMLVKHKRLTQDDVDAMYEKAQSGDTKAAEVDLCWCSYYASDKRYAYLPKDLEIIASTALQGNINDRKKNMPDDLISAAELCAKAFKEVKHGMNDKEAVFSDVAQKLDTWFETIPATTSTCWSIGVGDRSRFNLKKQTENKQDLESLNSKNVILYPTAGTPEAEKKFLGYFVGPSCQMKKLGFDFEYLTYDQRIAIDKPWTIVDRIKEKTGENSNVVMAWRKGRNGSLFNNSIIEFELMKNGMAVQHIIDEGQRGNANKVGNILQGMSEKFSLIKSKKYDGKDIFDVALGLDVSRYSKVDVPAFPVVIDKDGKSSIYMPSEISKKGKEKRSESEIVDSIMGVISDRSLNNEKLRVLFLRDGFAFEDYDLVASKLPENISLTVVSLRKNLLSSFSDDMPVGEYYAVYSGHDDSRFLFGINARQGKKAKLNSLHMAEIIRNPDNIDMSEIGETLIELSLQNLTNEHEIASLPFPIAYADRTSWVIRDMMQDRQLKKYVREKYPDDVNQSGDESKFIYRTIRQYVTTRDNGYAFAI